MDTELKAPDLPVGRPGYPSKGRKVGPAWNEAWAALDANRDVWTDGVELSAEIAPKHDLAPVTMVTLLTRMAAAGVLERRHQVVAGPRGPRTRTHYKISQP